MEWFKRIELCQGGSLGIKGPRCVFLPTDREALRLAASYQSETMSWLEGLGRVDQSESAKVRLLHTNLDRVRLLYALVVARCGRQPYIRTSNSLGSLRASLQKQGGAIESFEEYIVSKWESPIEENAFDLLLRAERPAEGCSLPEHTILGMHDVLERHTLWVLRMLLLDPLAARRPREGAKRPHLIENLRRAVARRLSICRKGRAVNAAARLADIHGRAQRLLEPAGYSARDYRRLITAAHDLARSSSLNWNNYPLFLLKGLVPALSAAPAGLPRGKDPRTAQVRREVQEVLERLALVTDPSVFSRLDTAVIKWGFALLWRHAANMFTARLVRHFDERGLLSRQVRLEMAVSHCLLEAPLPDDPVPSCGFLLRSPAFDPILCSFWGLCPEAIQQFVQWQALRLQKVCPAECGRIATFLDRMLRSFAQRYPELAGFGQEHERERARVRRERRRQLRAYARTGGDLRRVSRRTAGKMAL